MTRERQRAKAILRAHLLMADDQADAYTDPGFDSYDAYCENLVDTLREDNFTQATIDWIFSEWVSLVAAIREGRMTAADYSN